jgi:hypothetical protein
VESHKRSWLSTVLTNVRRFATGSRAKRARPQPPAEINPLPDDRAFDREENIEFLKQNYPRREYQQGAEPAPQPNQEQKIEKDKPLRGFHGG